MALNGGFDSTFPSVCNKNCSNLAIVSLSTDFEVAELILASRTNYPTCKCAPAATLRFEIKNRPDRKTVEFIGPNGLLQYRAVPADKSFTLYRNSSDGKHNCTMIYEQVEEPSSSPPTPPPAQLDCDFNFQQLQPVAKPKIINSALTSSINAFSSTIEPCNYKSSCTVPSVTVPLNEGRWLLHGFATLSSCVMGKFALGFAFANGTELEGSFSASCDGYQCHLDTAFPLRIFKGQVAGVTLTGKVQGPNSWWFGPLAYRNVTLATPPLFRVLATRLP